MNGSQIKEGLDYAASTTPRKSVNPEHLHKVAAHRVRVLEKGVERWAETADTYGGYRKDGIRAVILDNGLPGGEFVYKARDFLMPWNEYQSKREVDATEAAAKEAERERQRKEREAYHAEVRAKIAALGLPVEDSWTNMATAVIDRGSGGWSLTDKVMDMLVGRISELVYEALAGQE